MGLPLSNSRGDPSDGQTEVKSNRIGVTVCRIDPERIGPEKQLGTEVKSSWCFGGVVNRIVGWKGNRRGSGQS